MARIWPVVLAATGAVLLPGAAHAKVPPTGMDVCGAGGACTHLDSQQAGAFWLGSLEAGPPTAAAPFYVLRWHFDTEPDQRAYFVPGTRGIRWLRRSLAWGAVSREGGAALTQQLRGLAPNRAPVLTRVTIGGRTVNRPATYLRLLSGKPSRIFPATDWLAVTLRSAEASPWTNGAAIISLGKTAPYVVVDGWTFRIAPGIARRARRGLPLSG